MTAAHEDLLAIRVSLGWSQQKMAEALSYSTRGYQMVERGRRGEKATKRVLTAAKRLPDVVATAEP